MFKPADVQGNILRGYRKPRVRYLMLEVADRAAEAVKLRRALGDFGAPVDVIVMDQALVELRAKVRGTTVDRALREGRVVAES